jgi:hypothetical protein
MRSPDDDPDWKAIDEFVASIPAGPKRRWWGVIGDELEVQVSSEALVLSKGYRDHGASLEHPWLEMTPDELRGFLAKGEEILRAMEQAGTEPGKER